MEWWQILLDILPVLVTGGFSIYLYKLNKKDREIDSKLTAQEKIVESYRKELDDYKKNKLIYKNWLFEKRFDLMKEVSTSLYCNYRNALNFCEKYGTTQVDIQTENITTMSEEYKQAKADLDYFIKLAYSTQFYMYRDISSAFADFTTEMQKVINLYEKALHETTNYKVSVEEQEQNYELAKSINNKGDIIINKFQQIIEYQTTDFTEAI